MRLSKSKRVHLGLLLIITQGESKRITMAWVLAFVEVFCLHLGSE